MDGDPAADKIIFPALRLSRIIVFLTLNIQQFPFMKKLKFFRLLIVIAVIYLTAAGCNYRSNEIKKIQSLVDSLSGKYIPDKRTALAEINVYFSGEKQLVIKGECSVPALKLEIIKALDKSYKNLTDSIIILPDTSVINGSFGLVNLSVINMRSRPAHSAEMVSQALLGTPVRVLKSENSWYFIQTPDNYLGWAEEASMVQVGGQALDSWRNSERLIYLPNSGSVYSDPGMISAESDIVAGCILQKRGEEKGMFKVAFPDGREGYLPVKEMVDFAKWRSEVKCNAENIERSAVKMTGLPYLWGGTSTKGVDCSGFSKTVYFLNGVILQRDASQQALHGESVDISNGYGQLRPGDLLFFGSNKGGKKRVTHVAIYLHDNEYINSSGRVMRNSLDPTNSDYNNRENSLLSARRIIGIVNDPGIVPVKDHPWY
jgi:gamma-D-glutamyl-L-lysine dipeptidyl-peptidase